MQTTTERGNCLVDLSVDAETNDVYMSTVIEGVAVLPAQNRALDEPAKTLSPASFEFATIFTPRKTHVWEQTVHEKQNMCRN